jgi:hypothetical protein
MLPITNADIAIDALLNFIKGKTIAGWENVNGIRCYSRVVVVFGR